MDRKSLLAIILILLIFLVWNYMNQPTPEQLARQQQQIDSIQQQKAANEKPPQIDTTAVNTPSEAGNLTVSDSVKHKEQTFFLENDKIKIGISNIGAKPVLAEIKGYTNHNEETVTLVNDLNFNQNVSFPFFNRIFSSQRVLFEIVQNGNQIEATYTFEKNRTLAIIYTLQDESTTLETEIKLNNVREIIPQNINYATLLFDFDALQQEQSFEDEQNATTIYYKPLEDDVDDLGLRTNEQSEEVNSKLKWFAFKQKFFSLIFTAETSFLKPSKLEISTDSSLETVLKSMKASTSIALTNETIQSFKYRLYIGSNEYKTLKALGNESENIIDLGWSIISPVSKYLIIPLFNWLSDLNMSIGITILLLTLIIKLGLFPLSYRSFLSMAKMKVIRPEVEEVQSKFKKDEAMKSQQAVMALYKKAGVNPLGGCLPQLLQFPFLVSLFYFFPSSIDLRHQEFLWATDLSTYDSIYSLPFEIPFYGDHVSLFTLLMAASSFLYMRINGTGTGSTGNNMMAQQMKIMQYFFPVMMILWFNSFSAGLSYYYLLTNLVSLLQHFIIKKFIIDEQKIHRKLQKNKANYKAKPKSKFQQKLEKMSKAAQQKQNRR